MSDAGAEVAAKPAVLSVDIRRKVYGIGGPEPVEAVRDLAFSIGEAEIACLIGPSGAGKTTTLRILLGLDPAYDGTVMPDPASAGIGMVFQEPRLMPWRTVEQNVRLALPRAERGRDLDSLFESLGLAPWRSRYPRALSLGMARRVALARALALRPRILILDEPFVSLDDASAAALRSIVIDSVTRAGMSILMVTHNVAEAIEMADRLLLLSARPASLVATITLDRARADRSRAWADETRRALATQYPRIIAA